jgi:hypothetical protein
MYYWEFIRPVGLRQSLARRWSIRAAQQRTLVIGLDQIERPCRFPSQLDERGVARGAQRHLDYLFPMSRKVLTSVANSLWCWNRNPWAASG